MNQPPGGGSSGAGPPVHPYTQSRPNAHLRYNYDPARDELVFESGRRIPRPPEIPINSLSADNRTPRAFNQLEFQSTYHAASLHQAQNPPLSYPYSPTRTNPTSSSYFHGNQPVYRYNTPASHISFQKPAPPPSVNSTTAAVTQLSLSRPHSQHVMTSIARPTSGGFRSESRTTPAVIQTDLSNETEEEQKLYASFKRRGQPRKFFVVGKVFLTLWAEPAGGSGTGEGSTYTAITSGFSKGRFGERIHSKIRRFIVVKEGHESCGCLPIQTYQGQGVARKGVRKSDHAIIYTTKQPPAPTLEEAPVRGESGLLGRAIRIDVDVKTDKLDEMSRVNFGKVYNIEHNVKVKSLGKVNRDSLQPLLTQTKAIWLNTVGSSRQETSTSQNRDMMITEVEWVRAFQAMVQAGFTEERARALLHKPSEDTQDDSDGEGAQDDEDDESEPDSN